MSAAVSQTFISVVAGAAPPQPGRTTADAPPNAVLLCCSPLCVVLCLCVCDCVCVIVFAGFGGIFFGAFKVKWAWSSTPAVDPQAGCTHVPLSVGPVRCVFVMVPTRFGWEAAARLSKSHFLLACISLKNLLDSGERMSTFPLDSPPLG